MVAIGLVLLLLGLLGYALAPQPSAFAQTFGTWRRRDYPLWSAAVISAVIGIALMVAGLAVWLWKVMP